MDDGVERIKVLSSEVKDKAVLKIVEYLLSRKDMNDKYLNEEKSLKQMIDFIKSEARKKESNGIAMIEDEEVYSWAIHYWDETNENLNLSKQEEKVESKEAEDNDSNNDDERETTVVPEKKPKIKNWVAEGQLTLFDM